MARQRHGRSLCLPAAHVSLVGLMAMALLVLACQMPSQGPSRPSEAVTPEAVGEVVDWDAWKGSRGRYRIDTGQVFDINVDEAADLPETPRLSSTEIDFDSAADTDPDVEVGDLSVLLFVGQTSGGRTWYAAAEETTRADCRYEMQGETIFDEGGALLFGTGLRLPKAATFQILPEWLEERPDVRPIFPLGAADTICLDNSGVATAAEVWLDR